MVARKCLTRWTTWAHALSTVDRTPKKPKPQWDVERLVYDATAKGWHTADFARAAGLNYKTADKFLRGQVQTPRTGTKLAAALGQPVERYLVGVEAVA